MDPSCLDLSLELCHGLARTVPRFVSTRETPLRCTTRGETFLQMRCREHTECTSRPVATGGRGAVLVDRMFCQTGEGMASV